MEMLERLLLYADVKKAFIFLSAVEKTDFCGALQKAVFWFAYFQLL